VPASLFSINLLFCSGFFVYFWIGRREWVAICGALLKGVCSDAVQKHGHGSVAETLAEHSRAEALPQASRRGVVD